MDKNVILYLFLSLINIIYINSNKTEYRIYFNSTGKWNVVKDQFRDDLIYVATAFYDDCLEQKGFDTLAIETNNFFSDEIQAEGAGFLEGVITQKRIYDHYKNSDDGTVYDERVIKFFEDQEKYVYKQYELNPSDPIVYNVYLMRRQYQGIRDGYNSVAPESEHLTNWQFDLISSNTELQDVVDKYSISSTTYKEMTPEQFELDFLRRTHCSALWKVTNDLSDVIFGHNTWSPYSLMVRIFKEYKFNFNNPAVVAKNIIFSSYPATLSSFDDFYITSQQLVIIETTNVFYDDKLFEDVTPNGYLSWERAMTASRLSKTSKEWAENFSKYNGGTYNNQYMILDRKKVDLNNKEIKNDAFYIVEQLPGYCKINNVTETLKFGYWPSYNTPYDSEIIAKSKIQEYIKEHPNTRASLDYNTCCRANIFRRDQSNVQTIEDMKKILRQNNYKNDPFALENPCRTLSCRAEISGQSCFGAYDTKVSSVSSINESEISIQIIGGPTYEEGLPSFSFDSFEVCKNTNHYGIPNTPKFDWFEYKNQFPL